MQKKVVQRTCNRAKGNFIETQAVAFLMRKGYQVVARNYAYHGGELDIVARDVWNNQEGNPAARVNGLKQKKIWQTACHFLATQKTIVPKGFDTPCRFDVLSTRAYQEPLQFAHFKNAFEASEVLPRI